MARQRKNFEYESPIPDDELSSRMSSTAGRKLEKRLEAMGWTEAHHPQDPVTDEA
ncbi:hypothetical protein [Aeromicrobium sp. Root344]|uniref:hypothetical protein n=1 Tax=Aeromicrobium sp. Root344 TaxID=1736521 RepID=UPI000AE34215|nr:hypothetical protein [Aeromicrobium sp. Root344]